MLHWLCVAATPTTTVFRIAPGRSFDDAAALLRADFAGILVRDGWAPYRRFTQATHQTCLAHLLGRCRLLRGDHPRGRLPRQIQAHLQQALTLRDRAAAGDISSHGLAVVHGRLLQQILDALTTTRSTVPDVQRFAADLTTEASALQSMNYRRSSAMRVRTRPDTFPGWQALLARRLTMSWFRSALAAVTVTVVACLLALDRPAVAQEPTPAPAPPNMQIRTRSLTAAESQMWADYSKATAPTAEPAALALWAAKYRVTLRPGGRFDLPGAPAVPGCNDDPLHPDSVLPMQDNGCESHCWSTKMTWIYKQGGYWHGLTCDLSACSWDTESRQWICLYTRNCVTQRGNRV